MVMAMSMEQGLGMPMPPMGWSDEEAYAFAQQRLGAESLSIPSRALSSSAPPTLPQHRGPVYASGAPAAMGDEYGGWRGPAQSMAGRVRLPPQSQWEQPVSVSVSLPVPYAVGVGGPYGAHVARLPPGYAAYAAPSRDRYYSAPPGELGHAPLAPFVIAYPPPPMAPAHAMKPPVAVRRGNGGYHNVHNEDASKYDVVLENVLDGRDKRTTLMIKNIPKSDRTPPFPSSSPFRQ